MSLEVACGIRLNHLDLVHITYVSCLSPCIAGDMLIMSLHLLEVHLLVAFARGREFNTCMQQIQTADKCLCLL